MITTTEHPNVVQTNLAPIESRIMGIDAQALASITDSMVNLYRNKHLAVIREYATNALDAHRAAGNSGPVVIELPDQFDQKLVVTDSGIGMTREEVLDRYSQYGASDKRDTNTQVGSFGYGCKVGFAIGDQFSVVAVKDGWRTVALFARNEQRIGTANILSHTPVDLPDGVSVSVPITDVEGLRREVRQFLWGWKTDEHLVSGLEDEEPLTSLWDEGALVTPRVRYIERPTVAFKKTGYRNSVAEFVVLMGGVLYQLDEALLSQTAWNALRHQPGVFIVHAEIGEVDITPSREGLRDTDRTLALLEETYYEFRDAFADRVEAEIDARPSLHEAALHLWHCDSLLKASEVKRVYHWRGHLIVFQTKIDLPGYRYSRGKDAYQWFAGDAIPLFRRNHHFNDVASSGEKTLVILGVPEDKIGNVRYRLRAYCTANDYDTVYLAPDDSFKFEWFDKDFPGITLLAWENYIAVRKPTTPLKRDPSSPAVAYSAFRPVEEPGKLFNVEEIPLAELKTIKSVYYTFGDIRHLRRVEEFLGGFPKSCAIVQLDSRRKPETLVKRIPGAISVAELIEKRARRLVARFTDADRELLVSAARRQGVDHESRIIAVALLPHLSRLASPEVRRFVNTFSTRSLSPSEEAVLARYQRIAGRPSHHIDGINSFAELNELIELHNQAQISPPFTDQFPLLRHHTRHLSDPAVLEHAISYINAVDPIRPVDEQVAAAQTTAA